MALFPRDFTASLEEGLLLAFLMPTVVLIKGQLRGAAVIHSPQVLLGQQSSVHNNNRLHSPGMC